MVHIVAIFQKELIMSVSDNIHCVLVFPDDVVVNGKNNAEKKSLKTAISACDLKIKK